MADDDWWRSATIYQIYPKSFADGDNDGIGDVAGMLSRLPYLAELGIDAVWISPWYLSPQVDGGYDVTDQRVIDPVFGSVESVEAYIAAAHDLGIRVIVDIVPNHTSDQHRFFQEALASEPGSAAWQRYHCVQGRGPGRPPNDWRSVFGGSAWEPVRRAGGSETGWWYLHLFDVSQPDVNWEHQDVQAEFDDALEFWLDRGVDGFRIDVAHGLVKAPGYPDDGQAEHATLLETPPPQPQWDQPGVHDIWRRWRRIANRYQPTRAFVGEVWLADAERVAPYLRPDELHTAFNFDFLRCTWDGAGMREVVDHSLRAVGSFGAPTTWVLENHDVPRVRTRFGLEAAGAEVKVAGVGGLPQVTPDDELGFARARAALLFMLGLPGSAYIYQGQELGLPEVLDLPPQARQDPAFARTKGLDGFRDGCRVPIPWQSDGPSLGFNDSDGTWLPQPPEWASLSVATQREDPDSTLNLTRRALRLRRAEPALGDGALEWVSAPEDECLVLRRPGDEGEPDVIVAMNLGAAVADLAADEVLVASSAGVTVAAGRISLPPNTSVWLR